MNNTTTKKAYLKMHLSILLWGFTGILGKLIQLSEGLLVWYRMFLTSGILLLFLLLSKQLVLPTRRDLWKLSLIGFIIMVHWVTFYGAIKYSNVSIALSCFASSALFTALLEPLFGSKKLVKTEILFGLLAVLGIYLIFSFQQLQFVGIILALFSASLSALFTILNKRALNHYQPETITFYELSFGMIYLTILLPIYLHLFPSPTLIPNSMDWIYLVILSFFCTVIPFTMSLKALKHLTPFTLNLSVNLEPVYSIVLAIILFKENKELSWGFYLGTAIIMGSVVLHGLYNYWGKRTISSSEK